MDLEQTQAGSYKGVPFLLANGTVTGGNKNVVHAYPNSDRQTVENLGNTPRSYALNLIIPSTNYVRNRDALIAALEEKTPGPLIHPLYGRIDNVIAGPYSLNEDFTALGDGKLSVTMLVQNGPGIPEQAGLTVVSVSNAKDAVAAAILVNMAENHEVTPGFLGSFQGTLDNIAAAVDAFTVSSVAISDGSEYFAQAKAFADDAAAIAQQGQDIADRINDQYTTAQSLFTDKRRELDYMLSKFGFGAGNGGAEPKTAAQIQKQNNKDLFDATMRVSALSYAYVSSVQIDYTTLSDVQNVEDTLEQQYDAVVDLPGVDTDTREALADLRQIAQNFLDAAKLTAQRVVTVYTHPTTARLLAFAYYGDDTQGEDIANLNAGNVSNLSGNVQVLTE